MFNVAVPDIAREYHLNAIEVSWVITGYITLFALGALTFGKLADRYPVKRLILFGLVLFNTGALIGLTATSYGQLLTGRMIQACGGASIPALGMLTATRFVPPERRGCVLGAIAATVAFAAGIGPMLGGLLAGHWHWRYLFLVSLLTLLTLPGFATLLPREKTRAGSFDPLGALLTGVLVANLLLVVVNSWWPGLLVAAFVVLLLARHLQRVRHPFIPLSLLGHATFLLALLTTFLAISTVFAMMFLLPLLLRDLHGLPTLQIGLTIFPGAMTAAFTGLWAGRLADRIGSLPVVRRGLPLLAGGFALLGCWADAPIPVVAGLLVLCYSGFAMIHASLAKTVSLILPFRETGIGMGLYNLTFFLSGAFGTAFAGRMRLLLTRFPELPPWLLPDARPFSLAFFCLLAIVCAAQVLSHRLEVETATARPLT